MSVNINFVVSKELNDQIQILCSSNSISKHQWITKLIKKEISIFFKEQKQKEKIRKSWSIENGHSNPNLVEIGSSNMIPPAY